MKWGTFCIFFKSGQAVPFAGAAVGYTRKQAAGNPSGQYDQLKNDAMSYQDSHGQDFYRFTKLLPYGEFIKKEKRILVGF